MTRRLLTTTSLMLTLIFTSCVSKKAMKAEKVRYETLQADFSKSQADLKACQDATAKSEVENASLLAQVNNLKSQVDYLKENNTQA